MKPFASLLVAFLATACSASSSSGGSSSSSQSDETGDSGTCRYPAGAQVGTDASGPGCFAHAPGKICQVSNGATVLPDGGVAGGTENCSSLCAGSEYEMTCENTSAEPASSLGCQVIPVPTPSDVLFYCCPCAK